MLSSRPIFQVFCLKTVPFHAGSNGLRCFSARNLGFYRASWFPVFSQLLWCSELCRDFSRPPHNIALSKEKILEVATRLSTSDALSLALLRIFGSASPEMLVKQVFSKRTLAGSLGDVDFFSVPCSSLVLPNPPITGNQSFRVYAAHSSVQSEEWKQKQPKQNMKKENQKKERERERERKENFLPSSFLPFSSSFLLSFLLLPLLPSSGTQCINQNVHIRNTIVTRLSERRRTSNSHMKRQGRWWPLIYLSAIPWNL